MLLAKAKFLSILSIFSWSIFLLPNILQGYLLHNDYKNFFLNILIFRKTEIKTINFCKHLSEFAKEKFLTADINYIVVWLVLI